jgi:2-(1,2-epoxy-1,2-dihydrophenyl)acetyl-CoA isomerase
MTRSVLVEASGGVATIALNRPESLNAINVELLAGLVDALQKSRDARAIVLMGNGRAFCVGEDLKQTLAPRTGEASELRDAFEQLQEVTRLITSVQCPVLAAVQGYAVGGGAELALAADLVVAAPDAQFRFPEVPIGHAVTGGISTRLPAIVGLIRAKELLLTGRWIAGSEAHAIGMVNSVADDPIAKAKRWALELIAHPARSLAATKLSLESATVANQEQVLRAEVDAALYCFAASEASETFETFRRTGRPLKDPAQGGLA